MLITLGIELKNGTQIAPEDLENLVELASVSGIDATDFAAGVNGLTYSNTRPTLTHGKIHYDTTQGLEGLVYAFLSASNGSVAGWLYATPRRECYCWASSAVSAGTPVFVGVPGYTLNSAPHYEVYDGCIFPKVYTYSGASGPNPAFFITMETVEAAKPVKCMWAGLVPTSVVVLNGTTSQASIASPFFVDYAQAHSVKFGNPLARGFVYGVNTLNNATGEGAVIWGGGPVIEDYIA